MATVNRESYAAGLERLTADTQTATAAQLATTADEILWVARLLRGEPRLRRALTDPSRSGADRAELFRSLVAGKLGTTATEAVAALAHGRFSRPAELLDAVERLGVDTILASVEKTSRLFTVEENPRLCGWGAEIVSIVADEGFWSLDAPLVRITTPHVPLASAPALEDLAMPSVDRIADTVRRKLEEAR